MSPPDVFRTIKPEKSVKTSFFHDNTPSHRKYCWEIPPRSESHSLHSPQRRRRRRESPVSLSHSLTSAAHSSRGGPALDSFFFSSFSSVSHSHKRAPLERSSSTPYASSSSHSSTPRKYSHFAQISQLFHRNLGHKIKTLRKLTP